MTLGQDNQIKITNRDSHNPAFFYVTWGSGSWGRGQVLWGSQGLGSQGLGSHKAWGQVLQCHIDGSYCYDANGNLIRTFNGSSPDKSLTWTAYDAVSTILSTQTNRKVGFEYGPNRERIRRLNYASASATAAQTITHYVGSAEIRYTANGTSSGGFEEVRRTLGGMIIVDQRGQSH